MGHTAAGCCPRAAGNILDLEKREVLSHAQQSQSCWFEQSVGQAQLFVSVQSGAGNCKRGLHIFLLIQGSYSLPAPRGEHRIISEDVRTPPLAPRTALQPGQLQVLTGSRNKSTPEPQVRADSAPPKEWCEGAGGGSGPVLRPPQPRAAPALPAGPADTRGRSFPGAHRPGVSAPSRAHPPAAGGPRCVSPGSSGTALRAPRCLLQLLPSADSGANDSAPAAPLPPAQRSGTAGASQPRRHCSAPSCPTLL